MPTPKVKLMISDKDSGGNRRMKHILIAMIAAGYIGMYCLPVIGFPRLILERQARYEYLAMAKPCIEAVLYFNRECRQGREDPSSLVVYGYWLEDLRYYADFKLVGGIYGYADHYEMVEFARRSIRALHFYFEGYGVDYLIWDDARMGRGDTYYGEFDFPVDDPDWSLYFEHVPVEWQAEGLHVWRVK